MRIQFCVDILIKVAFGPRLQNPTPHAVANILALSTAIDCGILRAKIDIDKTSHVATRRAQATGKF